MPFHAQPVCEVQSLWLIQEPQPLPPPPPLVVDVTQAVPSQYWLDEQVVVVVVVFVTQAVPFQYWSAEHAVVFVFDCGELQHPPLYQYQPEDVQIAESKQLAEVLQDVEVVVGQEDELE